MTNRLWEASAADLRQWASECAEQARTAMSDEERRRLTKLCRALLDLADNDDWLSGQQTGSASAASQG